MRISSIRVIEERKVHQTTQEEVGKGTQVSNTCLEKCGSIVQAGRVFLRCGRPCSGMLGHPSERHRCDVHRNDVNMIMKDSRKEYVNRHQNQVKLKMLKVKEVEVEGSF